MHTYQVRPGAGQGRGTEKRPRAVELEATFAILAAHRDLHYIFIQINTNPLLLS